jgi:uncharacterized phage protein (TIGR01671 family)
MREIKFKAWDKEQEYMRSWENLMDIRYNERWFKDNRDKNYINCIFSDPDLILLQFTGLYDKNGKEIYEGDIIKLESTVNGVNLFEIFYSNSAARFSVKYYNRNIRNEYECSITDLFKPCEYSGDVDYEIVGNIYENNE